MNSFLVKKITDKENWNEFLNYFDNYDIYHTYDYHIAHADVDSGLPVLYVVHSGNSVIVFPMLERLIPNSTLKDATSVYGYPGPLTNITNKDEFRRVVVKFESYLKDVEGYVSYFSRINSLSLEEGLLANNFLISGKTVNVNIKLTENEQLNQYRSNHKRDIKKLIKKGFECEFVDYLDNIDKFMEIYNSTMNALNASDYYFFGADYYENIFNNSLSDIKMVVCKIEDEVACTGIFFFTNKIVQYHLGGTNSKYYSVAPTKLMFDFVRNYSFKEGYDYFHLGGGLGGEEDNLFSFKFGFSRDVRNFYLAKRILNHEVYDKLSENKVASGYFPLYRS
ncbi:GNAT family N-acetyltransferase [Vibrio campbellii]|uniref:GNAT family N-acetyltransferase n=1 Tax=Vibrio campbellii TaxID=680 RepID=UPI00215CDD3D|nr:GNAT family N-acetyltransferase [Vibrio campbellii]MCR9908099.1 GNAT family N-acetyltransferase [Vibrio campbellii]